MLFGLFSFSSKSQPLTYLALGDSYTIGESVAEADRWPNQLAHVLSDKFAIRLAPPRIIATTGWRTDNLADAVAKADLKNEYDLVSLLIGVNNQYQGKSPQQYEQEFESLLLTAIRLAKGKKDRVFVVSIPDYGFTPFGKSTQASITAALDRFNAINKRISARHGVAWYDITDISRHGLNDPSLVAEDGLHPSGKMYAQWVARISAHVAKQLGT
jgi:lysophospholipase L1-like esterase